MNNERIAYLREEINKMENEIATLELAGKPEFSYEVKFYVKTKDDKIGQALFNTIEKFLFAREIALETRFALSTFSIATLSKHLDGDTEQLKPLKKWGGE